MKLLQVSQLSRVRQSEACQVEAGAEDCKQSAKDGKWPMVLCPSDFGVNKGNVHRKRCKLAKVKGVCATMQVLHSLPCR